VLLTYPPQAREPQALVMIGHDWRPRYTSRQRSKLSPLRMVEIIPNLDRTSYSAMVAPTSREKRTKAFSAKLSSSSWRARLPVLRFLGICNGGERATWLLARAVAAAVAVVVAESVVVAVAPSRSSPPCCLSAW